MFFVEPGMEFEIVDFESNPTPGYVTPLGKGSCGIYAEAGPVIIKLTRHSSPEESYGTALRGQAQFGPFPSSVEKDPEVTNIWYFNNKGNYRLGESELVKKKPHNHVLVINNQNNSQFIVDYEPNIYKKFAKGKDWREIYANKLIVTNPSSPTYRFYPEFVEAKSNLNVSKFLSPQEKISSFTCRMVLSSGEIGMRLELSTGKVIELPFAEPDKEIMLFNIFNASFLIIPEHPSKHLLIFDTPLDCLDTKNLQICGVAESHNIALSELDDATASSLKNQGIFTQSGNKNKPQEMPSLGRRSQGKP